MKEKDYTLTVEVHVSKKDDPKAMRHYQMKIFSHPISENPDSIDFEVVNFRDEQALKIGKKLADAILKLADGKDKDFWEG